MIKDIAGFDGFSALDIRVGTITAAEVSKTKKPTYKMTIDFGPEVGTRACFELTDSSGIPKAVVI